MYRVLAAFVFTGACAAVASGDVRPGHRLPDGPPQPLRERTIDVQHLQATLRVDMARETVAGTAEITFVPLRAPLTEVTLDAARGLDVASVTLDGSGPLAMDRQRSAVRVTLPAALASTPAHTLRVTYSTRPRTGLYFFPGRPRARAPGLELRRGRHPLRLAAPVQRHRRPVHPRPADHRPASAGGGRQRDAPGNGRERRRDADVPLGAGRADPQLPDRAAGGRLRAGPAGRRTAGRAHRPPRGVDDPGDGEKRRATRSAPRRAWWSSSRAGSATSTPGPRYDQVTLRDFSGAMETTGAVGFSESLPPRRKRSAGLGPDRSPRPTRPGRARTPSPTSWPITGSATSSPAARWRRCG